MQRWDTLSLSKSRKTELKFQARKTKNLYIKQKMENQISMTSSSESEVQLTFLGKEGKIKF